MDHMLLEENMKPIKTSIIRTDESKNEQIAYEIKELCDSDITNIQLNDQLRLNDFNSDITLIYLAKDDDQKVITPLYEQLNSVKESDPGSVLMLAGSFSTDIKKTFRDVIDIFSGVTVPKIRKDFRSCIDLHIRKRKNLNYYLTDFFAPHLVGDLDRKGFELVLNDTFDKESYEENYPSLRKTYELIAPSLNECNREILDTALVTYFEKNLTKEEKEEIKTEFFFQFNTLSSLNNFSERRLYYIERSVIENSWSKVIDFVRSIDNSLHFGCYKFSKCIYLKVMINKAYPLKKISKKSDIYKTLLHMEPYGDIVVTSKDDKIVIGSDAFWKESYPEENLDEESTVFNFYVKVILPHRRHRGLKRY